jgi:hypothetical protein
MSNENPCYLKIISRPMTSDLMREICHAGASILPDRMVRCKDNVHRDMIRDLIEDYEGPIFKHTVLPDGYVTSDEDKCNQKQLTREELWVVSQSMSRVL